MLTLKCRAIAVFFIFVTAVLPSSVYPAVADAWVLGDREKAFR